jgi:hypothetical protein
MSVNAVLGNVESFKLSVSDRFAAVDKAFVGAGIELAGSQQDLLTALKRTADTVVDGVKPGVATPEELSGINLVIQMQQAKVTAIKNNLDAEQRHSAAIARA